MVAHHACGFPRLFSKLWSFQRTGNPLFHNKIPLLPQITLQVFYKWAIDFIGSFNLIGKHTGTHYIITATDYLTIWAEVAPVKECTTAVVTKFLFENVITWFGCPNILISGQGTHLVDNPNSISFVLWTWSCDSYGLYCTDLKNFCVYSNDICRFYRINIVATCAARKRMFCRSISPKCWKMKEKSMAWSTH